MPKNKNWNIREDYLLKRSEIGAIAEACGLRYPTAALLYNRGYHTPQAAKGFLEYESELMHDPFLLTDMEKACEVIEDGLATGLHITIYGDYDVDGVTSVSALYLYLSKLGAKVDYYIPNRTGEGYGINVSALDQLAKGGTKLLLTVDTGVTAVEEVEYAKRLGMKVIVTDHHECYSELPEAEAVVNPRRPDCEYPFKDLAGAGVAFKLICALEYRRRMKENGTAQGYLRDLCREYIDLITLGTVADVMPLIDENRLIVSMGLAYIDNTERPGLRALIEQASGPSRDTQKPKEKKKITSSTIGYVIAPRINAAGRISCASKAVDLFLTKSEAEAQCIAAELCDINRRRQSEENQIIEQSEEKISREHDFDNDYVIVLDDDNWHHGVIGIVASRITERYDLPSILISFDGDIGKGSGRSIKGLNLVDALKSCDDLLIKYGGHELAAGLSIERSKLPEFRRRINEYARERIRPETLETSIDVDMELGSRDITIEQAKELDILEPFGIANEVPLFTMKDVKVLDVNAIGAGRHTRFSLEKDGTVMQAVCFGSSPEELGVCTGEETDILFNLNLNEYQRVVSPQLLIRDIRYSEEQNDRIRGGDEIYDTFCSGGTIPAEYALTRDDIAKLYNCLKRELPKCGGVIGMNGLRENLNLSLPDGTVKYDRVKLKLMLDVLTETGLITVGIPPQTHGRNDGDKVKITLEPVTAKINLEKSAVYKRLRAAN